MCVFVWMLVSHSRWQDEISHQKYIKVRSWLCHFRIKESLKKQCLNALPLTHTSVQCKSVTISGHRGKLVQLRSLSALRGSGLGLSAQQCRNKVTYSFKQDYWFLTWFIGNNIIPYSANSNLFFNLIFYPLVKHIHNIYTITIFP